MTDKRSVYSEETLTWFDDAWSSGMSIQSIQEGMVERGHALTHQQLDWMADRRGLMRPSGHRPGNRNGQVVQHPFDDMMQRRLTRSPTRPQDNLVVKPDRLFKYAGGFRMGGSQ